MLSIQPGQEMKVGVEWIRYPEMNVTEDYQSLHVDHLWKKCSPRKLTVEISLNLPKMFKCTLALCNSNAHVEMPLSVNKTECVHEG